jgi:hypothetical protein
MIFASLVFFSNFDCPAFVHLDTSGGIGARRLPMLEQGRPVIFRAQIVVKPAPCPTINSS